MMTGRIVVTCEHAGNAVPAAYRRCFGSRRAQAALESHRGYDPGAWAAAKAFASFFRAPLLVCGTTRLLAEVNRSKGHPQLFSEFTEGLTSGERRALLARYYEPHRTRVDAAIARLIAGDARVLHLAVHTFTPRLGSEVRNADLGLLYDPARRGERSLCRRWQQKLQQHPRALRVRRNYPYRGNADGLTTALRRRFPSDRYLGIELEMNQRLVIGQPPRGVEALVEVVATALSQSHANRSRAGR